MKNIFHGLMIFFLTGGLPLGLAGQQRPHSLISAVNADTWVATDALGRSLVNGTRNGLVRQDRFVGIFYFLWQGAHGYDTPRSNPGGEVLEKLPGDTLSPYDNSRILARNPADPDFGPVGTWHYWSEPYFGYYLAGDPWVIRKHAAMLSDAGVDVIIFDATNGYIYFQQVSKIAKVFKVLRKQGQHTPSIAFMVNAQPKKEVRRLYEQIYQKGLFRDLWFYWKGKPLLLTPPEGLDSVTRQFFTTRQSWAWKDHWNHWFGNGKDKWPWLDHTPQAYGWHESSDKPEEISVAIAEHPIFYVEGRSFHDGKEPPLDSFDLTPHTALGLHFAEQWKRALAVDPEFVFITGWNEWVAASFKSKTDMKFLEGKPMTFCGRPIKKGDTYFVDEYNQEFSRDAEPMKGGFTDDYYYQMVNYIRKYKGARPVPVVKGHQQVHVDGQFNDWGSVQPKYEDHRGDTFHRDYPGWGRIKAYVNNTGRNDIISAKVATDDRYLFFYVQTSAPLTSWVDSGWMRLFIKVKGDKGPDWNGFNYRVNAHPRTNHLTTLERCAGGWRWEKIADIAYAYQGNLLELQIPKKAVGIKTDQFTLDFKWSDHAILLGNPMHWWNNGDAAPDGRFCYRYCHLQE